MGVFDQEASFTLDSTPETEPAAAATSADEGHVDNQGSESQAPETTDVTEVTNETDESTATQEVNKEEKPGEKPSEPKLLAKKYKTMGGLVNGIAEAAKLVGQTINWNDLDSTEEMEETYFDLQRQIGRGEIKTVGTVPASRVSQANGPEEIVQEAQTQQSVFDQELQKIIDASNAQLAELETDTGGDEFDEEFETKLFDDPRQVLAERDAKMQARLRKEFEARLNLEGAKLVGLINPYLQKSQEAELKTADTQAWEKAIENFGQVVSSHGDNDLEEFIPGIPEYLQKNPELYDLINANRNTPGIREKVLSLAYRDLKLNKKLAEFAKTTADKDKATIENSKGGLRIQSGVGGGANGASKKGNDLDKIFGQKSESIGIFG
jgi:hypothetical protein